MHKPAGDNLHTPSAAGLPNESTEKRKRISSGNQRLYPWSGVARGGAPHRAHYITINDNRSPLPLLQDATVCAALTIGWGGGGSMPGAEIFFGPYQDFRQKIKKKKEMMHCKDTVYNVCGPSKPQNAHQYFSATLQ